MPRKSISGFAEAGAAMAQQLDDNDVLNLFSAIGRVVSKRFLMKRPCLDQWQLVIDYLRSAMGFELREQFRVLYLDKRNNLIADEVMHEGTVDHTPVYPREVPARNRAARHRLRPRPQSPVRRRHAIALRYRHVQAGRRGLRATWYCRPRPCDHCAGWAFQPSRAWPAVRTA